MELYIYSMRGVGGEFESVEGEVQYREVKKYGAWKE